MAVRLRGVAGEIPTLMDRISNPGLEAGTGTMLGRRFDWGGRLPKSNGGARKVRSGRSATGLRSARA